MGTSILNVLNPDSLWILLLKSGLSVALEPNLGLRRDKSVPSLKREERRKAPAPHMTI